MLRGVAAVAQRSAVGRVNVHRLYAANPICMRHAGMVGFARVDAAITLTGHRGVTRCATHVNTHVQRCVHTTQPAYEHDATTLTLPSVGAIPVWPVSASVPRLTSVVDSIRHFLTILDSPPHQPDRPNYTRGGVLLVGQPVSHELESVARAFADRIGLAVFTHSSDSKKLQLAQNRDGIELGQLPNNERPEFFLCVTADRISACVLLDSLDSGGQVVVDFTDLREYKRAGIHGYESDAPLVQACITSHVTSNQNVPHPTLIDATMGLGMDSFLLASFGAKVNMIEQDAILTLLMIDGLRRAAKAEVREEVREITSRMAVMYGDASSHLRFLSRQSASDSPLTPFHLTRPDVIYADPFYPDPPISSLSSGERAAGKSRSKKSMELAKALWKSSHPPRVEEEQQIPTTSPKEKRHVRTQVPNQFHPSTANKALYQLLSACMSFTTIPAATANDSSTPSAGISESSSSSLIPPPRVILKQPATPYARRLVLKEMRFVFAESFRSRDTVFHRIGRAPDEPTPGDTTQNDGGGKIQTKREGARPRADGKVTRGKQIGRRGFHTDARPNAEPADSTSLPSSTPASSVPGASSPESPLTPFTFTPLGTIRSVFSDKYSIPRQSSLSSSATCVLTLDPNRAGGHTLPNRSWVKTCDNLKDFSHVWLVFVFHKHEKDTSTHPLEAGETSSNWMQMVRPPRLGGTRKVGVFASRSPYRPCGIGLSAVKIDDVLTDESSGVVHLHLSGCDLLDGTPILDIKPYIPYCDAIPTEQVKLGWAQEPVPRYTVTYEPGVESSIAAIQSSHLNHSDPRRPRVNLGQLIHELVELDPRHGYQRSTHRVGDERFIGRKYGFQVLDWNVNIRLIRAGFVVESIETMEQYKQRREQQQQQQQKGKQEEQQTTHTQEA